MLAGCYSIMARVVAAFVVNNLKTEGHGEKNIWRVIERFETGDDKKVIEEDSKFISDSSALLVFDMSLKKLNKGMD